MSYEEKSVWIQLGAMILGLGAYFVLAGRMLAAGEREMAGFAALLILSVIVMVVLLIISHAIAALFGKVEGRDERDRLIAWKAEHRSGWLTTVGVLGGVTCMALGVHVVWIANLLLLSLVIAEVAGFALQILYYRRGV